MRKTVVEKSLVERAAEYQLASAFPNKNITTSMVRCQATYLETVDISLIRSYVSACEDRDKFRAENARLRNALHRIGN